jgi:subtilisin family serine protease
MTDFIVRMLVLIALVGGSAAALAQDTEPGRTGEYIVLFNGLDDPEPPQPTPEDGRDIYPPYEPYPEPLDRKQRLARAEKIHALTSDLARTWGLKPTDVYDFVLFGFSAQLTPDIAERLRGDERIKDVFPADTIYDIAQVQNNPPSWGLDRIDERARVLDNRYFFWQGAAGTNIFVMDTGLRATHTDFAGRVGVGRNFDGGPVNATNDCNGHGTHVAGTAAGTRFGVAKQATVHAVKVNTACTGQVPVQNAIGAMNWIAGQLIGGQVPNAVTNMSLRWVIANTPPADVLALETAIVNAINAGVVVVVAAGNDSVNACTATPARVPQAITVGSTTNTDARSGFSNIGGCIDLFAPGSSIVSAGIANDNAQSTKNGTSMASPHVAGVVALHREFSPAATPAAIRNLIVGDATAGVLSGIGAGSPNVLLHWYEFLYWNYLSGNNGNGRIHWWNIGSADRYVAGDFNADGTDDLLAVNPNGWHHTMRHVAGAWQWIEGNGSGQIALWFVSANDRYVAGDFDGDGRDELLAINPVNGWHHTMRFNGSSWQWISGTGGGQIALWGLSTNDRYVVGDFNADGRDELLAINPVTGWHHVMRFNGSSWQWLSGNGGGQIAWWNLGTADSYVAGRFAGGGRDQLLALNPNGWHHLMQYNGSAWQFQAGAGSGQIGWWNIGSGDRCSRSSPATAGRTPCSTTAPASSSLPATAVADGWRSGSTAPMTAISPATSAAASAIC